MSAPQNFIFDSQKKTSKIEHLFLREPFWAYFLEKLKVNDEKFDSKKFLQELTKSLSPKNLSLDKKQIESRARNSLELLQWQFEALEKKEKIKSKIDKKEKLKILRGMLLTRATDNALKKIFLSGEVQYEGRGFQGKGFRSLGQEAIYAAALKLNCGLDFYDDVTYIGDIAAPLIRDLGVFLAFSDDDIYGAINAQAGKTGLPSNGRDLHLGNLDSGLLMPAAPLAVATCSLIGLALAFKLKKEQRVALSFIGEGGTSLGEWHEAINFASVQKLPMIFCVENNQTALSTKTLDQSCAYSFSDKARAYGMHSLSIDGNDPLEIASAFKVAADHARSLQGPVLIEVNTMRMCGHAHHDDMLYLGYDPKLSFDIPEAKKNGYVDNDLYEAWRKKDPIKNFASALIEEKTISKGEYESLQEKISEEVSGAILEIKNRPWPKESKPVEERIFSKPWFFIQKNNFHLQSFDPQGQTYLQAIKLAVETILSQDKDAYLLGEDVALPYGNAFMMFKDLDKKYSDRLINTPISENAIVGSLVGMATANMKPIGEIQFNDFVACSMNQVVNNMAKVFFRTQQNLPLVLRLPYGGLRRAGPFHSQDTSPWFYRSFGLKIMAPSTPNDALNMFLLAARDPDPVLFYEHIALYRDPKIKQQLKIMDDPLDLLHANVVREGKDVTIVSYGAYVHKARDVAQELSEKENISAEVIDLRYLMPLDFETIQNSVKKTSKLILCGEDSKTGSILESIASKVNQSLFDDLDAPIIVLGSKDTPVPYAPSLEDEFLLAKEEIYDKAVFLVNY